MFIELLGYIVEPPEIDLGLGDDFSYSSRTPVYEPMLINTETVTLISPADNGEYALIFLSDGLVLGTKETFVTVSEIFKKDYLVIKTSDN